jgi:chemotaxis protein methyltransferase CheR
MLEMNDVEYKAMLTLLDSATKYHLENYSKSFILRRIETRIRRLNLATIKDYLANLKTNAEEGKRLFEELSIHVTHFFRDKVMYDIFMLESMFDLLKNKDDTGNRILRIWSAGCSSGEEPYSIAIILQELLGNRIKDFSITITGTDIDKDALEIASIGIYEKEQLQETTPIIVGKYFQNIDGKYKINEDIRKMVSFRFGDILNSFTQKSLDIIFCRNVVIYFSPEIKEKLFMNFYEGLNHHGFLVLGKTESLTGAAREKFIMKSISERIYFKE